MHITLYSADERVATQKTDDIHTLILCLSTRGRRLRALAHMQSAKTKYDKQATTTVKQLTLFYRSTRKPLR